MNNIVVIDEEACIGCGTCVEMCPTKILFIDDKSGKCRVTDENLCDRRRGCESACPTEAIKVAPKAG